MKLKKNKAVLEKQNLSFETKIKNRKTSESDNNKTPKSKIDKLKKFNLKFTDVNFKIQKNKLWMNIINSLNKERNIYQSLEHIGYYAFNNIKINQKEIKDPALVLCQRLLMDIKNYNKKKYF